MLRRTFKSCLVTKERFLLLKVDLPGGYWQLGGQYQLCRATDDNARPWPRNNSWALFPSFSLYQLKQNRLLTGIFNGFILIFSKTSFTMHITSGKISCVRYLVYIMQDMVEVSVSACLHPVNWPCLSCVHRWSLVSWRSPVLHFVCFVFLLGGQYQIKTTNACCCLVFQGSSKTSLRSNVWLAMILWIWWVPLFGTPVWKWVLHPPSTL